MTPSTRLFKSSYCETMSVRGLTYNIRKWGSPDAPPMLFLHGSQDCSTTFQFVVNELKKDWLIIAPDWRGHGHSDHVTGGYWFHDFVTDLDVLVKQLFPHDKIPIIGHSMGGNIGSIYSGLRPERVSHFISLNGFGPLVSHIPVNIYQLLDNQLNSVSRNKTPPAYPTIEAIATRLIKANNRLSMEKAIFLAEHSSYQQKDGRYSWLFDPSHRHTLPSIHNMEEWGVFWSKIKAPVLWLSSEEDGPDLIVNYPDLFAAREKMMPNLTHHIILDSAHNIHHDQPEQTAKQIEKFLAASEQTK